MDEKKNNGPQEPRDSAFGDTMASGGPVKGPGQAPPASEGPPPESATHCPATIGKHYRVVRKIGEGGMGTVYEVEHTRMGKRFAAKVISKEFATSQDAIRRFELEAIAASRIESPHIVQVVHMDTEGEVTYIIMELLKGRNLAVLLMKREVPLPLAVEIARQTAKGLIAAHEAGIIHRDLKPENIFLISQEGRLYVKILDFGISKIKQGAESDSKLTKTGQIIGTPLYFSPEQARGLAGIDGRTDIYSLGVILYEMATLRPIFDAKSPIDLMVKHATEQPVPPRSVNPAVPEPLERVILKCLAKDPAGRYQTAAELLAALDGISAGPLERDIVLNATTTTDPRLDASGQTGPVSLPAGGSGKKRSKALLSVIVGMLLLAVVAAAAVFVVKGMGAAKTKGAGTDNGGPLAAAKDAGADEGPGPAIAPPAADAGEETGGAAAVRLAITTTAPGAEVWIDGKPAGPAPFDGAIAKDGTGHEIEVRAKGYLSKKVPFTADADFSQEVTLVKAKKKPDVEGIKTTQ